MHSRWIVVALIAAGAAGCGAPADSLVDDAVDGGGTGDVIPQGTGAGGAGGAIMQGADAGAGAGGSVMQGTGAGVGGAGTQGTGAGPGTGTGGAGTQGTIASCAFYPAYTSVCEGDTYIHHTAGTPICRQNDSYCYTDAPRNTSEDTGTCLFQTVWEVVSFVGTCADFEAYGRGERECLADSQCGPVGARCVAFKCICGGQPCPRPMPPGSDGSGGNAGLGGSSGFGSAGSTGAQDGAGGSGPSGAGGNTTTGAGGSGMSGAGGHAPAGAGGSVPPPGPPGPP